MKETERPRNGGTYYFFNLGCPKNLVDAERLAALLEAEGWEGTSEPADADLLVVTTCAFISMAEEESIGEILRVASGKRKWQKLAVLGCLVSREGDSLKKLLPEVDIFLDVDGMHLLPGRLAQPGAGCEGTFKGRPCIHGRRLFTPPHIAYLKIADGCSNHCSYCTIPGIRGELRSRPAVDILDEARHLVECGVRELIVIAQDTGAWNFERGGGDGLCDLLETIAGEVRSAWIRVMYLHPSHIDLDRMIGLLESGAIRSYLDIPVQHASDRILDLMQRGYGRADLERLFGTLRSRLDDLVLRTTVMVGFPGETTGEFRELVDFLEEFRFDHVGVFTYSRERGTRAASFGPVVSAGEVERRRDEILDIQMDISHERLMERVGRVENVLVDEVLPEAGRPLPGVWGAGRSYGQAYDVDGVTFLTGRRYEAGSFIKARNYRAQAYDIFAAAE